MGLIIASDDNDSANFDPFEIRDDRTSGNDLLFFIDHTGTVQTGIWDAGAVTSPAITSGSISPTNTTSTQVLLNDSGVISGHPDLIFTPSTGALQVGGNAHITGDMTISGDDIFMGTNTTEFILVADGTNFNPVYEYISKQNFTPACLIYFTDLDGKFPKKEAEYPTMWLTTSKDKTAPFGTTVRFN